MRKKIGSLLAGLTLLVALTGCMEINAKMHFGADDNAHVVAEMKYDKSKLSTSGLPNSGDFGAALKKQVDEINGKNAAMNATFEETDTHYIIKTENSGNYMDPSSPLFDGAGTAEVQTPPFTAVKDGNILTITLDVKSDEKISSSDIEQVRKLIDGINLEITFDGQVIESSSGTISGNKVTWNTDQYLDLISSGFSIVVKANMVGGPGNNGQNNAGNNGGNDNNQATSPDNNQATNGGANNNAGGLAWWIWLVIGGGALVIIGVVAAIVVSKNKKKSPAAQNYPGVNAPQGYPQQGYPQQPPQGYPQQGYPQQPPQSHPQQQPPQQQPPQPPVG